MSEHLTFWQQFLMALAHGGPPTVTALVTGVVAYLKLRKRHEQIVVMLNGGLKDKINKAVEEAVRKTE